ncbi:MAG: PolC-type DNA polymerase III [Clostridia bacterium]
MNRCIKDVFKDCNEINEVIGSIIINELKYSKKQGIIIIDSKSECLLSPSDIGKLERNIKSKYELNSCIFNYQYTGEKFNIDNDIIKKMINRYCESNTYATPIFRECEIDIAGNNIIFKFPEMYSSILKIRKADKQLSQDFLKYYNKKFTFTFEDSENAKKTIIKDNTVNLETLKNEQKAEKYVQNEIQLEDKKSTKDIIKNDENLILGKPIYGEVTPVSQVSESYKVIIEGQICDKEERSLKNDKTLLTLDVTDLKNTITVKMFVSNSKIEELSPKLKKFGMIKVSGRAAYDNYSKSITITATSIEKSDFKVPSRMDNSIEKRVELHLHTKMSAMDAVSSPTDIVKEAIKWGHKAIAITDHGVVQAFPEAHLASVVNNFVPTEEKEYKIKILYGMEGYLIDDLNVIDIEEPTYCILDIETTGFDRKENRITEIAVAKVKNGEIIDEFSTFVNPKVRIPANIVELTNITDELVKDAPTIQEVMPEFIEFIGDSILVAHNSPFDIPFLKYKAITECGGIDFHNLNIDTLHISRSIYPEFSSHKLGDVANKLDIEVLVAHRAIDDVHTTVKVFNKMNQKIKENGFHIFEYASDSDQLFAKQNMKARERNKLEKPYHIILFAKNYVGLKNLYKIVSYSNLRHFKGKPRIPKSLLKMYSEGIIIGSACEQGEVYKAVLENAPQSKIENLMKFYDYLEIQPIGNNAFMLRKNPSKEDKFPMIKTEEDLKDVNRKIVELGEKYNKLVVATCDTHFLNPEDSIYREFIQESQGYDDFDKQPPLFLRTTEEMLNEFLYLGEKKAKEIVITNTNKIADMIDQIQPVPDGTYPPSIENSEKDIENMCYEKAKEIYGDPLPEIVDARLKKELTSIIKHGFAVMYMIAHKLVKKSNEWGYLVGSRGSVGSSFVATMSGITEVNPLPPHYICQKCKYSEFVDTDVTTGVDMEDKNCPNCNIHMKKDGMDIPFETFLGFKGDKVPDIDLNFSGDVQSKIHAYTGELFGEGKTFKAGTIGTIAEKTALAYVIGYYKDLNKTAVLPEMKRLSQGCVGVKKSTGQHPGGVIVVPHDKDIYDFCPVQHPADDVTSSIITTHFDFHSIHDNLLKLDMLGHDDPTIIKMLENLTGVDAKTIPLDEPGVMSLFKSTEILGVTPEQIYSETGTYAVPEFGTKFVRQMLKDTKPTTFGELVRISGLSHGTDVWLGNAQTLIQEKTTTLKDSICCRDDIMIYLIKMGMDPGLSFKTMESVRKGKGLKPEMREAMEAANVPLWYIESCLKIKYMFPKAHAAAYVMMAYRIAYYKVYYPKEFYATYLTIRANTFDSDIMLGGLNAVKQAMVDIDNDVTPTLRYMSEKALLKLDDIDKKVQNKDKDVYGVLEVVNEMLERKINFLPVDLYKSDAVSFLVEEDGIRPPLSALNSFGEIAAKQLVDARKGEKFDSQQDVLYRAKLGKTAMQILEKNNCFEGLPKSDQLDFFEM